MSLRVAALAPYPDEGPSTRFRIVQLAGALAERGIHVDLMPFVQGVDYGRLYEVGAVLEKLRILAGGLRRRTVELSRLDGYHVALVHRELAPVLNGPLLARLRRSLAAFVFDFDDAVFLPARGGNRWLRRARSPDRDTARFCREASRVLAGNEYLASYARRARGHHADDPAVVVLPTVVDTERFEAGGASRELEASGEVDERPLVGWVGTHSTLPYLETLFPVLRALADRVPFRLRVVSNRPPPLLVGVDMEYMPWRPESEVAAFQGLDIGLYPLVDDAWTRGKCGFKAIQYLSCEVPTVASPVGVLPEIVLPGETGELASDREEWLDALESLLRDPERRARLGRAGRAHVRAHYSIDAVIDALAQALRGAARVNGWVG